METKGIFLHQFYKKANNNKKNKNKRTPSMILSFFLRQNIKWWLCSKSDMIKSDRRTIVKLSEFANENNIADVKIQVYKLA